MVWISASFVVHPHFTSRSISPHLSTKSAQDRCPPTARLECVCVCVWGHNVRDESQIKFRLYSFFNKIGIWVFEHSFWNISYNPQVTGLFSCVSSLCYSALGNLHDVAVCGMMAAQTVKVRLLVCGSSSPPDTFFFSSFRFAVNPLPLVGSKPPPGQVGSDPRPGFSKFRTKLLGLLRCSWLRSSNHRRFTRLFRSFHSEILTVYV